MRRIPFALALVLVAAPVAATAQSSQLSVSGLGVPGRGLSVRSWGTGGSTALFDGESSLNPAALGNVIPITAALTGVEDFRRVENPAGDATARGVRFPQFILAGGLRGRPLSFGLSYSSYTVRDFTFGVTDTVALRGVPVAVGDTFSSRGGLSDIQIGTAYRIAPRWSVGAGFHIITGSNRLVTSRGFSDSAYVPTRQQAEFGFSGLGLSVGIMGQILPTVSVAAMARTDGHLDVVRNVTNDGTIDLPYSFAGGVRWGPSEKLDLGAQILARTWSAANQDLIARGEPGAKNTIEASFGGEFVPDPLRPFRRPLRFGVRYATLPFLMANNVEQPTEVGVSLGSGVRFAAQRAGIDLALERIWRSAGDFNEGAWLLSVGVSVRP